MSIALYLRGNKLLVEANEIEAVRHQHQFHIQSLVKDAYSETFQVMFDVDTIKVNYTQGILTVKIYPKSGDETSFDDIAVN